MILWHILTANQGKKKAIGCIGLCEQFEPLCEEFGALCEQFEPLCEEFGALCEQFQPQGRTK